MSAICFVLAVPLAVVEELKVEKADDMVPPVDGVVIDCVLSRPPLPPSPECPGLPSSIMIMGPVPRSIRGPAALPQCPPAESSA